MASRWYVIHVYSGFEKKVAASIREQAEQKGLADEFEEILVPTEEVVEVKRGAKVSSERKFFPGYVLIKMDMNDETWHLVKNTAKVTGFLGGRGVKPSPISDHEAARIMHQVQEGIERPKPSVTFEVGEQVRVSDGPFTSFNGLLEEVDEEKVRPQDVELGMTIAVVIAAYADRSCAFVTKSPPNSYFLKKAAGVEKGSQTTGKGRPVGRVTMAQIREIAEQKMQDLNANDLDGACRMLIGSARSMGLEVVEQG